MIESIFCHVLKVRAQVKSFNRIAWNRFFRPQFSFDIDNADIIPFVCIIFCCEHVLVNMARFVLQLCYIFGAWCFFLLFFSSSCFSISFHSSLLIWFNYEITVTHTEISTLLNLNRMSTRNAKSPELVHNYFIHFPFSVCAFSIFFRSHRWLQSSNVNCKHWFPLPWFFAAWSNTDWIYLLQKCPMHFPLKIYLLFSLFDVITLTWHGYTLKAYWKHCYIKWKQDLSQVRHCLKIELSCKIEFHLFHQCQSSQ